MEIIGLGILATFLLYWGWRRSFFDFPHPMPSWEIPLTWVHVVLCFAIYFVALLGISPLLVIFLRPFLNNSPPIAISSWLNFLISLLILFSVLFYALRLPNEVFLKIWRRPNGGENAIVQDFKFALWAFVFVFPVVIFLNESFDFILESFFHIKELPDQLAVRFLKMTFHFPLYFVITTITIVVLAPLLEETLFRGFLQSFIRQHLGTKWAILITAICFSLFHYSKDQGAANLTIVASLFALALFLGFVYEKRGSLITSIFLHAIFNITNVINLYFFGECQL
ncbi:MAG: CPBP family intramembrane metalloprotease [Chlamydiae bacterium]|nr:CPBP family intramembrane metalloprotease [Chlamydiota bacterium]